MVATPSKYEITAEYVQNAVNAILKTLGEPQTDRQREALQAFHDGDSATIKRLSVLNLQDNYIKCLGYLVSAPKLTRASRLAHCKAFSGLPCGWSVGLSHTTTQYSPPTLNKLRGYQTMTTVCSSFQGTLISRGRRAEIRFFLLGIALLRRAISGAVSYQAP